jgi:hypothetical protein
LWIGVASSTSIGEMRAFRWFDILVRPVAVLMARGVTVHTPGLAHFFAEEPDELVLFGLLIIVPPENIGLSLSP